MTILQGIWAAIEAGKLKEPFTARDVAEALGEHHFSYGSLQSSLARYSRDGQDGPLRRVARGTYRLSRPPTEGALASSGGASASRAGTSDA